MLSDGKGKAAPTTVKEEAHAFFFEIVTCLFVLTEATLLRW